ncbi:MAG: Rieske 2Fe-2S domain-containing protein [Planctomycetota bacterium]|nr:Rieske 2Fe-2S domain-containing protein [Planctomycetota bacterium]
MSDDLRRDDVANVDGSDESSEPSSQGNTRRGFFEIASIVLGAIVGVGPALIGLVAFLDPLRGRRTKPKLYEEGAGNGTSSLVRVASMEALSLGEPQRFLVIDDQIDAWNFTPDEPVGAVYIEKLTPSTVRVFNTTCPHAGCSVECNGTAYECPCHSSSFNLNGTKSVSGSGRANPSPRDMDALDYEVRDGEIWVDFKNFYTGRDEKKAKA